jgi:hypothetical protein
MLDANGERDDSIKVQTGETGAPYLILAAGQVPQVRVLFDGVGLPYTLDERQAIAEGEQPVVTLLFGDNVDVDEIQDLLDGID